MSDSPDTEARDTLAGIIIETAIGLRFVPAKNALVALDNPRLSPLPGTPLELLWFEGRIVPAASFGLLRAFQQDTPEAADVARARRDSTLRKSSSERSALVCEHAGQLLGLTSVELLSSGRYPQVIDADGEVPATVRVRYDDTLVEAVDLEGLFAAAARAVDASLEAGAGASAESAPQNGGADESGDGP